MYQTKRDIQAKMNEAGISPRKRLGQNFLTDSNLMDKLVAAAEIREDDLVLEVGTGTGALTERLIELSRSVVSIEIDRGLYNICKKHFEKAKGLTLIHTDILDKKSAISKKVLELLARLQTECGGRLLLVANLPYQVATSLLVNLLLGDTNISSMCFTVQAEVAERMQSQVGKKTYGPLSVFVQGLADIKRISRVPPQAFWPIPKVDSVMLKTNVRKDKRLPKAIQAKLTEVVHHCFNHRRKTMMNNLRTVLEDKTLKMVEADGRWNLSDRPERMTVSQWIELAGTLCQDY